MEDIALFHTADLHDGAYRFLPDSLGRCNEMFEAIYNCVIQYQARLKILVIAGDIFDRKNITEEERNLFFAFVVRMVKMKIHIVMMNGNHDYYTESLTLLQPFKYVAALNQYLHVVLGEPASVTIEDIGFGCVPCQQDLTTEQLASIAKDLHKRCACSTFYMIVHEAVYGSANFRNTWKAKSDKYLKIPSLPFVTGWMLGDIHQRQQVSTNAWYSGAPLQIKSDESPSNGILQWIGSKPKFHPLKIRGFRFTNDFDEALKYAKAGHYVRFKGKVPPGSDIPSNIVCDDSIAAIEVDLDYESGSEVSEFKVTIDLIGPLPKFLAARGMQPRHQTMAIEMVSSIIQSRNSVIAEELEDVED